MELQRRGGSHSEEYSLISDEQQQQQQQSQRKTGQRKVLCLSLLFAGAVVGCLLAFYFWYVVPALRGLKGSPPTASGDIFASLELGWINRYRGFGAEGSVTLLDIDGDGIQDIIYAMAQPSKDNVSIYQPLYCKRYKDGCLGMIVGLRGTDGDELWALSTKQEVFELNCGTIDIDKDGHSDCLGAGRKATIVALNPRTGKHLWQPQTGRETYFDNDWNIYNPLVLPDLDGDGVSEVFVAHGGDPLFPPENHTRFAARFMVLSGANGEMLGTYFQSPDGKETYNSPVLHSTDKGTVHILFGTGGETVNGSLYAIAINRLLCLTNYTSCGTPKGHSTVKEIFRSRSKGIMVPVVISDVNGDGTNDIICITFDGIVIVFDGTDFSIIWQRELPGYESYATPAVGYFNDDNQLDIVTVWNRGQWPDYSQCLVIIMDGANGNTLWSFVTSRYSVVSPLVIRTVDKYRDAFVIGIQGRMGDYLEDTIGVVHGIDPQRKLTKSEPEKSKSKRNEISCGTKNLDLLAAEVLLVDSSTLRSPIRIWRREVDKYYYDPVTYAEINVSSIVDERLSALGCEVMIQASRNTGSIGDVDGDGLLDLVVPFGASAIMMKDGEYYTERMNLEIVKISLEKFLSSFPVVEVNSTRNFTPKPIVELGRMRFSPASKQPWTAYMGTSSDSVYRHHG